MYKLKYCFIFGRELVGMLTQILVGASLVSLSLTLKFK